MRAQLFSVEGVLIECAHMLRRTRGGAAAAVHLIEEAGTQLVTLTELGTSRPLALMAKYRDVIEWKSDDHRTLSAHVLLPDGTWQKFMTAHYRRKK